MQYDEYSDRRGADRIRPITESENAIGKRYYLEPPVMQNRPVRKSYESQTRNASIQA